KPTLPADHYSNPSSVLQSVSCASAGECSAVGYYFDSSGNQQGVLLSESGGTWGAGVKPTLPADAGSNPNPALQSVSCASAGECRDRESDVEGSGDQQGGWLSESGGTWGAGVKATRPGDADSNPDTALRS